MIDKTIVTLVDLWLDNAVSPDYQAQPLAQDWARISKLIEELSEALAEYHYLTANDRARLDSITQRLGKVIAELILATGQNPRKPQDPAAFDRMLREIADTVMTGVYGLQHFTKNADLTEHYLRQAQAKHLSRVPADIGVSDPLINITDVSLPPIPAHIPAANCRRCAASGVGACDDFPDCPAG